MKPVPLLARLAVPVGSAVLLASSGHLGVPGSRARPALSRATAAPPAVTRRGDVQPRYSVILF